MSKKSVLLSNQGYDVHFARVKNNFFILHKINFIKQSDRANCQSGILLSKMFSSKFILILSVLLFVFHPNHGKLLFNSGILQKDFQDC